MGLTKKLAGTISKLNLEPIKVDGMDGFKLDDKRSIVFLDVAGSDRHAVMLFSGGRHVASLKGALRVGQVDKYESFVKDLVQTYKVLDDIAAAGAPAKFKLSTKVRLLGTYFSKEEMLIFSAKFGGNSVDDMQLQKVFFLPYNDVDARWEVKKIKETNWTKCSETEAKELLLNNLSRERPVNFNDFVAMWNINNADTKIGMLSQTSPNTAQLSAGPTVVRFIGGDKIKIAIDGQVDPELLLVIGNEVENARKTRKKLNSELCATDESKEIDIF